jgi:hypothetical protein
MKVKGKDLVLYRFFDDDDQLLYIGKSIRVWSRFVSHQSTSEFFPEAAKVTLQRGFGSHDDLLDAEKSAIWVEQPRFNKLHKNPLGQERFGFGCRSLDRRDFDVVTDFVQGITIA